MEHRDGRRPVAGPRRQEATELFARLVLRGGTLSRFEALRSALRGDRRSQVGELLCLEREQLVAGLCGLQRTSRALARGDERGHLAAVGVEVADDGRLRVQITDNSGRGVRDEGKVVSAIDMNIQRLDREERRLGLRGIGEDLRIPRSTTFSFSGFGPTATPPPGLPVLTTDAVLAFGRSRTRTDGGDGDVRLLIGDVGGKIDEELSQMVSRRHFEVYVENDRLMLRVNGSNGLRINGKAHGVDTVVRLSDGDIIAPVVKAPDALTLAVRFARERDQVCAITIAQSPEFKGAAL